MSNAVSVLTIDQVADRLSTTGRTVRRLIATGDLRAVNIGTGKQSIRRRVLESDLAAFLRKRRM